MAEAGAAIVIDDADLEPGALAAAAGSSRRPRDGSRRWRAAAALPGAAGRRRADRRRDPGGVDLRVASAVSPSGTGAALHFIAIGGAGMSGLALVCHRLGARVSGSDRAETPLHGAAARRPGSSRAWATTPTPSPPTPTSSSRPRSATTTPSSSVARERGQRVMHRGELLAELCELKRLIAVAGTHGKTTTAGMLAHALGAIGGDPAFLLGGELPGAGDGAARPTRAGESGEWIVAEADESRRQLPATCGPRSRWSRTSSSTIIRAGPRAPSCWRPSAASASPRAVSRFPPDPDSTPSRAASGSRPFDLRAPRARASPGGARAPQPAQRARRARRARARGLRPGRGGRGARRPFRGCCVASSSRAIATAP